MSSALALLGRYFAGGSFESRDVDGVVGRDPDIELADTELEGLRLRVALSAARRLESITGHISKISTFRYEIVRSEQTGAITGTLDVNRWATTAHRGGAETVYPVQNIVRGAQTPENILAAWALRRITRELRRSLSASGTAGTTDDRAARTLMTRLEREQQRPPFAAVQQALVALRTRSAVRTVLETVSRRIQRREIPQPAPWLELTDWVRRMLEGDAVFEPGEHDLAVYDETFDNKLFELWCLRALAQALSTALNIPEPSAEATWRSDGRVYVFHTFAGDVNVYFQRSIPRIDKATTSRWKNDDGALGGIPDIVVTIQRRGKAETGIVVIDPKLRQRRRTPAEELYKILGYFQNYTLDPPRGAILTYTTGENLSAGATYRDGSDGALAWTALNPTWDESLTATALGPVVEIILDALTYSPGSALVDPALEGLPDDERAAVALRNSFRDWARTQVAEIAPSMERVATMVGDARWSALDADARLMLATADTIGPQLAANADFSGPVIGMSAAIEHLIHDRVISHAFAGTTLGTNIKTFGQSVYAIRRACQNGNDGASIAIRARMSTEGINLSAVSALIQPWSDLNTTFRIPAAHRDVLSQQVWRDAYRFILADGALLMRTFDALKGP